MAAPYPRNVPGPFYVEAGCCITCAIPVNTAPDVFAWDDRDGHSHCYIYSQPRDADALERVIDVMWHAEAGCIHYRGTDESILKRLHEQGLSELCDVGTG